MKGTPEARPVFVQTKAHIRAHLMVCFIALTMMRLVQRKVREAEAQRERQAIEEWKTLHDEALRQAGENG